MTPESPALRYVGEAREIIQVHQEQVRMLYDLASNDTDIAGEDRLIDRIAAALTRTRREALFEAAILVDEGCYRRSEPCCCEVQADHIRTLASNGEAR